MARWRCLCQWWFACGTLDAPLQAMVFTHSQGFNRRWWLAWVHLMTLVLTGRPLLSFSLWLKRGAVSGATPSWRVPTADIVPILTANNPGRNTKPFLILWRNCQSWFICRNQSQVWSGLVYHTNADKSRMKYKTLPVILWPNCQSPLYSKGCDENLLLHSLACSWWLTNKLFPFKNILINMVGFDGS